MALIPQRKPTCARTSRSRSRSTLAAAARAGRCAPGHLERVPFHAEQAVCSPAIPTSQRATDRVPMQPGPAMDLPGSTSHARNATAGPPPTAALRPPRASRARSAQTNPGSADPRTLRWSSFQPAQVVQFSPGADTRRPRHTTSVVVVCKGLSDIEHRRTTSGPHTPVDLLTASRGTLGGRGAEK